MTFNRISDSHLRLVSDSSAAVAPPLATTAAHAYVLERQPQRPGELCCSVRLDLPVEIATAVERAAAQAGVPSTLWITLAIEGRRCLDLVRAEYDFDTGFASSLLDRVASCGGRGGSSTRLADYARALRDAQPRRPLPVLGGLAARPSVTVAAGWARAAEVLGCASTAEWARMGLGDAPGGIVLWEAAAAGDGRSLGEWALLQAARASRAASTRAQRAV